MNIPRGPHYLSRATPCRRRRQPTVFAPHSKSSAPATPLQHWNFVGHVNRTKRRLHGPSTLAWPGSNGYEVSARKLAACLWWLRAATSDGPGCDTSSRGGGAKRVKGKCEPCNVVGLEHHIGNVGTVSPSGCLGRGRHSKRGKQLLGAPPYNSQLQHGIVLKLESRVLSGKYSMQRKTKWDSVCSRRSHEAYSFCGHMTFFHNQVANLYVALAMQPKLLQAQRQIFELEAECWSCKKKLERIVQKYGDEGTSWKITEHKKFRDLEMELSKERKRCKTMEILNSKLVNELGKVKASARQFRKNYDKEKKAREFLEEVCNGLVEKIIEDKAEVEVFKEESIKIQKELQEERKMLQISEVWREERVQMKLIDAKLAVENKYNQMNKVIADLETFMRSGSVVLDTMDLRTTDLIRQAAKSVNINDMKEFSYVPAQSGDIYSIFEEIRQLAASERVFETSKQPGSATDDFEFQSACSGINGCNNHNLLKQLHHVVDDSYFQKKTQEVGKM